MAVTLQKYCSRQDMYENYSTAAKEIEFEGRIYEFKGSKRVNDRSIHLYYCEQEQHYIRVNLQFNLPFLIEPFYSVNEVTLNAVYRAS
ncbi:MAG: hypothetical protein ABS942_15690 [Solibacillus sp.]